jgi:hypothetical protein
VPSNSATNTITARAIHLFDFELVIAKCSGF